MATSKPMGPTMRTRQSSRKASCAAAMTTSVLPVPGGPETCRMRLLASAASSMRSLFLTQFNTACCSGDHCRRGPEDRLDAVQNPASSRPSRMCKSRMLVASTLALKVEIRSTLMPRSFNSGSIRAKHLARSGW